MTKRIAMGLLVACVCATALADVVVDQPYDGSSLGRTAQEFPDYPGFSIYQLDDFTTAQDWQLGALTVTGSDAGDSFFNYDVVAEIWDGLPEVPDCGTNGQIVLTAYGTEEDTDTLTFDFGGQLLPAGSYWLRAYVVRDFGDHGIWSWLSTTPVNGEEGHYFNPDDMFGYGPCPIPGWERYGDNRDMAFLLEGTSAGGGCAGDLDGDGQTGQPDLGILLADWGCTGGGCAGDLDGDGETGQPDLGILLADWGCVE